MDYESTRTIASESCEGVTFRIARISFARRLELTRRVREIARRVEFQHAGNGLEDKIDAALSSGEMDRVYLEWGLVGVDGLTIDGETASPQSVIESGPEALCREVVREIRRECGLTEEERKN